MFSIPRVVARALIYRANDQALLLARSSLPGDAGYYSLPGGGIERRESPMEGILRELHEELRLSTETVLDITPTYQEPCFYEQTFLGVPFSHTAHIFTLWVSSDTTLRPNWEIAHLYWAGADEATDLLHPRYRALMPTHPASDHTSSPRAS
jgi:8-oxo-dGTP pyrophosphatase MutT (NUDIX family)